MRTAARRRVLLSEASSFTAREFVTVLGRDGAVVDAMSSVRAPIARFSRYCRTIRRVPAPSQDPLGYLAAADRLMTSGEYDALLPTHEQAWLFSAGRHLMRHRVEVADIAAFDRVESKIEFARLLDDLRLPQPAWRLVENEDDLSGLDFPVWLKAEFSTAGRGVVHVPSRDETAAALASLTPRGRVMAQAPAPGRYAQVQGLFRRGRLLAAAASELLATGVGGSAAARVSVHHPEAVTALERLGAFLSWHGGLGLDYFHEDGRPCFIECNPRISEPANAAAAGVDLPALMIGLADDAPPSGEPVVAQAGVRTRSTLAIGLGAAETAGTRRGVAKTVARALLGRSPRTPAREVLTPVLEDPPSLVPFVVALAPVLARPAAVRRMAARTVADYSITPEAVARVSTR